jgi:hypothetical protein
MTAKLIYMFANIRRFLGKLSLVALVLGVPTASSTSLAMEPEGHLHLQGEVVRADLERDGTSQVCHLRVKLRFKNEGATPLILLLGTYGEKREWWVLDAGLSRSLQDALDGKPFWGSPAGPANSQSLPMWGRLRKQLSTLTPPPTLTHVIQPHEIFLRDIDTFVVIRDGDNVTPGSRVWLQLAMEMWPSNIEPAKRDDGSQPFGESLRRKWQTHGDLRLEPILSSPIPFDLPATSLP